jgi:RNA polymerase sigma-70 factor (ECF subfamily)
MPVAGNDRAKAAAERAARQSYGKLVAYLAARTRDLAGAEDALADAFAAALVHWPQTGIPARPEAWLLTAARRRIIDAARRAKTADAASDDLEMLAAEIGERDEKDIPDQRLRLMFACAHPAIDPQIRAPLMLQTVLGFDAATIASAFLVSPATMGQRLVRAKTRIRHAGIPFTIPERPDLPERLDAVLEAVYATYAEGWVDPTEAEVRRRGLSEEGIWLGRMIASLMPEEPEALGLLALMLFAEARRSARRTADGGYMPLAMQDIALWDEVMIGEAETLLRKASRAGTIGCYQIEAAIQSAHVAGRRRGMTDWNAIEALYQMLVSLTGSPVAALNHAVAAAEAHGAAAGLALLDDISGDGRFIDYQPYWAARAELLMRTGDSGGALAAYNRAIGLESDPAIRAFLQKRLAALTGK